MSYVFELTYPGVWLEDPDRDWAWDVQTLVDQLESLIADAALALSLFEQALRDLLEPSGSNQPGADADHWQEAWREAVERGELDPSSAVAVYEWALETERTGRREMWRAGHLPKSYRHRLPFIHARSYLFTMDRLERHVGVLASMSRMPQAVVDAPQALRNLMPQLRGVRNSVAHVEDRIRGLGRDGRPLDLKPMENRLVSAPGGVLAIENLFGSTMADGSYGEVEVSAAALQQVAALVQQIIDAFEWTGPVRHEPT